MFISSRTPEGSPSRCPICDSAVAIEPSFPFADAPCPNCGTLLWFFNLADDPYFFAGDDAEELRRLVHLLLSGDSDASDDALRQLRPIFDKLGADSIDIIALMMELEEGSK